MNKADLKDLLQAIAENDLADGCSIYDHPCAIAIRAIDRCFSDIERLQVLVKEKPKCKRDIVLVSARYNPEW
jgi:hypothetical protein